MIIEDWVSELGPIYDFYSTNRFTFPPPHYNTIYKRSSFLHTFTEIAKETNHIEMGSNSEPENMVRKEEKQRDEHDDEGREKLPGFRFHPTDEELVSFYLRMKVENKPLNLIKEVDIYKYDPWDLPSKVLFVTFSCISGS